MSRRTKQQSAGQPTTEVPEVHTDEGNGIPNAPANSVREGGRRRGAQAPCEAPEAAPTSPGEPKAGPVANPTNTTARAAEGPPSAKPHSGNRAAEGEAKGMALPFADVAERFLQHLEATGKSRATVFSYSIDLGAATRAFGADTDIQAISEAQVTEFFASHQVTKTRSGKAKSQLTVEKTRRVTRQIFTWAAEEGLIPTSPIPTAAIPNRRRKDPVQDDHAAE